MKTIEEKFEYIRSLTTWKLDDDYALDVFRKGYELAQKEMEERLREAEQIIKHVEHLAILPFPLQRELADRSREYFKKWGVE